MKYLSLALLLFLSCDAHGRTNADLSKTHPLYKSIDVREVAKHIGDTVWVHGEMLGFKKTSGEVFIDLGTCVYPTKVMLTVILMKSADDNRYVNWSCGEVSAWGIIVKHNGKLQVTLTDPSRLLVAVED